eukprot:2992690-Pleurochrysis_carterae.AAC.4
MSRATGGTVGSDVVGSSAGFPCWLYSTAAASLATWTRQHARAAGCKGAFMIGSARTCMPRCTTCTPGMDSPESPRSCSRKDVSARVRTDARVRTAHA